MSRGAILSILGLYSYDDRIFDYMSFPDGFTAEQKSIVINNILAECAELEVLYPNTEVMKNIIGVWSKKEKPYWNRVYSASLYEYNPIENYRRTETESIVDQKNEKHSGEDSTTMNGSGALDRSGTTTNSASGQDRKQGTNSNTETNSGTDSTTNSVTGYDSNDFVAHDKSDTTYGHKITNSGNSSDTVTYGRKDVEQFNNDENQTFNNRSTMAHGENIAHNGTADRTMLAYGNIGVTTSQEMLTQEMEIAKMIQVVPIIIESFKNRFCLLVY